MNNVKEKRAVVTSLKVRPVLTGRSYNGCSQLGMGAANSVDACVRAVLYCCRPAFHGAVESGSIYVTWG